MFVQFAISNGNGEDLMILEHPIRGFDFPRSDADDQYPVSLLHEFGGGSEYVVSISSDAF